MLFPLAAVAKIGPIEFQYQRALPIRSLAFLLVDGRPHTVSGFWIHGLITLKSFVKSKLQKKTNIEVLF